MCAIRGSHECGSRVERSGWNFHRALRRSSGGGAVYGLTWHRGRGSDAYIVQHFSSDSVQLVFRGTFCQVPVKSQRTIAILPAQM